MLHGLRTHGGAVARKVLYFAVRLSVYLPAEPDRAHGLGGGAARRAGHARDGHGIAVGVVGLLSVIFLMLPDIGVMTWKEAQPKVPWDVFVLYGAGLSMGTALTTSGAAEWLAGTLFSPLDNLSIPLQMIIMIWAVTLLQVFFTGGGPKTTALTPIVIAHAVSIGADPRAFALVLGMNMHHQYLLPVSNMPNAVAMGTGEITSRELNKTGAVMSVLAAAFMSLMVVTYWSWIGLV